MSVIFSMGCLVIGQLLLRHHMIRPQDSAEEVVSPPPTTTTIAWVQILDPADRFARTSIYAAIITRIAVWKHWLYCTASRIPYFSGRKFIAHRHVSVHAQPSDFVPLDRIASFFVAFVFMALVDSEGKWQRYPTAVVMFVFVALLIWCVWTTWEGRADFVEHARHSLRGSPTGSEGHTPDKDQPGQHDDQETSSIRSVRVDPITRSN